VPGSTVAGMVLRDVTGRWTGTNGFRLMPGDPLATAPATLAVTTAAAGHLLSVAYTWEHPDDGPQDGLLVVGAADEAGRLVALWGDSWHQQPAPMSMTGHLVGDVGVELQGEYGGGWGWRITVEMPGGGVARLRMANVVPGDQETDDVAAGPYDVMVLDAGPGE
jgi:hypothetical protein